MRILLLRRGEGAVGFLASTTIPFPNHAVGLLIGLMLAVGSDLQIQTISRRHQLIATLSNQKVRSTFVTDFVACKDQPPEGPSTTSKPGGQKSGTLPSVEIATPTIKSAVYGAKMTPTRAQSSGLRASPAPKRGLTPRKGALPSDAPVRLTTCCCIAAIRILRIEQGPAASGATSRQSGQPKAASESGRCEGRKCAEAGHPQPRQNVAFRAAYWVASGWDSISVRGQTSAKEINTLPRNSAQAQAAK